MPQVIALALLGAGIYAGYRWLAHAARRMGEEMQRHEAELRGREAGRIEKDLGALEYDPSAGVYRPARKP